MSLLQVALREYGNKETPGKEHNEKVVRYFQETGFDMIEDDETAWCSAFMIWCAMMAGEVSSNKLNARSWLEVGSKVYDPQLGDVVVFWRKSPDDWRGHVGIYISEDRDNIYCLGGNQSNMVNIAPYSKERVLGFRRLYRK